MLHAHGFKSKPKTKDDTHTQSHAQKWKRNWGRNNGCNGDSMDGTESENEHSLMQWRRESQHGRISSKRIVSTTSMGVKSTCWAINREIPQSPTWLWRVCVSSSFLCVVYMQFGVKIFTVQYNLSVSCPVFFSVARSPHVPFMLSGRVY